MGSVQKAEDKGKRASAVGNVDGVICMAGGGALVVVVGSWSECRTLLERMLEVAESRED